MVAGRADSSQGRRGVRVPVTFTRLSAGRNEWRGDNSLPMLATVAHVTATLRGLEPKSTLLIIPPWLAD